jgi:hypothetical protein
MARFSAGREGGGLSRSRAAESATRDPFTITEKLIRAQTVRYTLLEKQRAGTGHAKGDTRSQPRSAKAGSRPFAGAR